MYSLKQKLTKILLILLVVNLCNSVFVFWNNDQWNMNIDSLLTQSIPKDDIILQQNRKITSDGIIVKYKKQRINLSNVVWYMSANTFAQTQDLEVVENEKKLNISLLESKNPDADLDTLLNNLKWDESVEYAQPNYIYKSLDLSNQNDTHKNNLWGLYNYGQNIAWTTGFSGSDISWDEAIHVFSWSDILSNTGVIVAVLDSWVAYNHPDLINNMWDGTNCKDHQWNFLWGCLHGYDYDDNDKNPILSIQSHGTHVSWIIAASMNNSGWVIWTNPKAKIMALKHENFTTLSIVNSINFAKYNGAKIINASFGWYNWIDQLMYDSIKSFWNSWWLFIAAAGNGNQFWVGNNHDLWWASRMFPAWFWVNNTLSGKTLTWLTNVISVAATNNRDTLAPFSDYWNTSVHIGSPWVYIYSTIQWTGITVWFSETFSWTYSTGNIYSFSTGGTHNNFWANYWIPWIWGDKKTPFSTGSTTSYIEKQINISALKVPFLNFNAWCDAGNSNPSYYTDYMQLSFSTGGTFVDIDKIDYFNSGLDSHVLIESHTWSIWQLKYDISKYKSPTFKVRMTWISDATQTNDLGCLILWDANNPFEIVSLDDGANESYWYMNGTSMATPYVVWLASLAWSYRPDLSFLDIKNAILQNGDSINSLSWKTITWKRINAYKTLLAITPPDFIPNQFNFLDFTWQLLNTLVESNPILITGINTGSLISITGWEYRIWTGSYKTSTWLIYSWNTLSVRNTTSSSELSSVNTIVTIGWISDTFTSTTRLTPDTVPNQFNFLDFTGQLLNTVIQSNPIVITGINTGSLISITGWEYKIWTGSYTTFTWVVYSWNFLTVKHTTSQYNVTDTHTIVNIWWITDAFTSKTYIEEKQVLADNSNSWIALSGTIKVWSGFAYIWEIVPTDIYSFTGWQVSDFLTGSIFESSWSALVEIFVESGAHLYTSTWNIKFEKKNILWEEKINGNIKQIFTWAIKIWSDQTILLDKPAIIKYVSDKNATKIAYKKTGTSNWNIITIEANECSVDLINKAICSYKVWSTIYIKTYHFTDFALVKEETIPPVVVTPPSSWGGGGWWWWWWWWGSSITPITPVTPVTPVTPIKDTCPNGDYSSNLYDKICGTKPTDTPIERVIENKKDNNVVPLQKITYTVKKQKYWGYELINVDWYKLSIQIIKISKFIINNKKILQEDKKNYVNRLNEFLLAKYYLDTSKDKSRILKSKYNKQVILLKWVIKKLSK